MSPKGDMTRKEFTEYYWWEYTLTLPTCPMASINRLQYPSAISKVHWEPQNMGYAISANSDLISKSHTHFPINVMGGLTDQQRGVRRKRVPWK